MELKTLWLGILLSLAAFAVKAGVGWGYLWTATTRGKRVAASALLLASYVLLFSAVFLFVRRVNLVARLDLFLPLWRHGVTLHWVVSLLLFVWGLLLLRRGTSCAHSRGWLALVIPCPVCLCVVLVSVSLLSLYFPEESTAAMFALFAAFAGIAAASGIATIRSSGMDGDRAESTLGVAMMLVSSYFVVSALVAPTFAEIGRVYRLLAYASETRTAVTNGLLATFGAVLLVALAGFVHTALRLRGPKARVSR